ncbi:rhodanese-like domain-containing protein [Hymenobacter persicinus]|uniref:Rhodanese-like domain-containing protein n=1 Tax=Hymenobacter persicinus TaxID=2025506 RepID=A0A4Q5LE32_9BACT|nr:rhodanese-like domain-containing protein [Hymenobacter persicinus]RYU80498.1 rhodanese-like domain-containing protein [Hymenobacter persicinus]
MLRFLLSATAGLLLTLATTCPAAAQAKVPVADVATTHKLAHKRNVVVLDVRTPAEYATGHLRQAQNLDFKAPDFAEKVAALDPTKTYLLYCASGNRSGQASAIMQEKGFAKVVNGGAFKDLKAAGLKTD